MEILRGAGEMVVEGRRGLSGWIMVERTSGKRWSGADGRVECDGVSKRRKTEGSW